MKLKIATKLLIGFIVVALIAGAVGLIGLIQLKSVTADYAKLYEDYGVPLGYLTRIEEGYQRTRVNLRDMMLESSDSGKKVFADKIKTLENDVETNMDLYEKSLQTADGRAKFAVFKSAWVAFKPVRDKQISLAMNHKEAEAEALAQGEGMKISQEIDKAMETLIVVKIDTGEKQSKNLLDKTNQTSVLLIIISVLAMVIAIALGLFISKIICNPVKKLVGIAETVASGDLAVEVVATTADEIGMLQRAFSKMVNNTNDVLSTIHEAAEQVASGAIQVSQSSIVLSQGATEQASSVEQLSASVEEISSQTKLNADNAKQANELAEKAKQNAVNGNEQMKVMLRAMDDINEASSSISRIIKVIDDIAFQTNILALNAAVEAARAGQHGKGFAVVAEEVRNLAARSANAAMETTAMIEGSIKKVTGGTKIANDTADALNMIVEDVAKAATLVSDIASASNEQANGINQISQGIVQVSTVIQSNSATSEESAAASEELSSQAQVLKEQVGRFKLKGNTYNYSAYETENKSTRAMKPKAKILLADGDIGKY